MKSFSLAYEIAADTKSVHAALTSQEIFERWSGRPARINAAPGGEFSIFDGGILGRFLAVSESEIMQSWKEKSWNDLSRVTFTIRGKDAKTILELRHEEIPDYGYELVQKGWDEHYLTPLKNYLEGQIS